MRVTLKFLESELAKRLNEFGIEFESLKIYKTYARGHELEGGAANYICQIKQKECPVFLTLYIYYNMKYMQERINKGDRLTIIPRKFGYIQESEFGLKS